MKIDPNELHNSHCEMKIEQTLTEPKKKKIKEMALRELRSAEEISKLMDLIQEDVEQYMHKIKNKDTNLTANLTVFQKEMMSG